VSYEAKYCYKFFINKSLWRFAPVVNWLCFFKIVFNPTAVLGANRNWLCFHHVSNRQNLHKLLIKLYLRRFAYFNIGFVFSISLTADERRLTPIPNFLIHAFSIQSPLSFINSQLSIVNSQLYMYYTIKIVKYKVNSQKISMRRPFFDLPPSTQRTQRTQRRDQIINSKHVLSNVERIGNSQWKGLREAALNS
jgi:hypothetical protein